jgi:hypothetical protein
MTVSAAGYGGTAFRGTRVLNSPSYSPLVSERLRIPPTRVRVDLQGDPYGIRDGRVVERIPFLART